MSESSVTRPVAAGNPIYTTYEWKQWSDMIVPLLLACPVELIRSVHHDMRQLFTDNGRALFGYRQLGYRLADYSEFICDLKTGRYEPADSLLNDAPSLALRLHGSDRGAMQVAFENEFAHWLDWAGKTADYELGGRR